MTTTRACLLGLCALLSVGCVHHRHSLHPHGMPPGQAKKVAHVHVSGCGHVLVDGAWISVSSVPGPKQGKGRGN